MNTNSIKEPRLVQLSAGSSNLFTVEYKERFLYSKYNPARAVLGTIQSLEILPGTLIVICGPALWYGLPELLEKIPQDCSIVAIEKELPLFNLSKNKLSDYSNFPVDLISLENLNNRITEIQSDNKIKRAIRIDFSASVSFNPDFYNQVVSAIQEAVALKWKNRLTLTKLGRLYSRNIFKNLYKLKNNYMLSDFKNSVSKPIIVFGAGESTDIFFKENDFSIIKNEFFTIAVDAALPALTLRGFKPDAVVGIESQFAVQKSYLQNKNSRIIQFADLTGRPQCTEILGADKVFFTSKYIQCNFLENIQNLTGTENLIPPMGSVGLTSTYIALKLRKSDEVPVIVIGNDFSFKTGKTHCKGTPQHLNELLTCSRFKLPGNIGASFREGAFICLDKNNRPIVTDKALLNYANIFNQVFSGTKNLFDGGRTGLPLGISRTEDIQQFRNSGFNQITQTDSIILGPENLTPFGTKIKFNEIQKFLETEKTALIKIQSLLSCGEDSEYREASITLDQQLKELLEKRDYLYIHFPDGNQLQLNSGYLKRIKAELSFFIKDINQSLLFLKN